MISRYSFGKPFETEALVVKIEATEGKLPFFRTDGEGNYYYDFDDKDIVYGLGEQIRGINKRGWTYTSWNLDNPHHHEDTHSLYGAHNFLLVDGKELFGVFFDFPGKITFDIGYTKRNEMHVYADRNDMNVYIITGDNKKDIVNQFRVAIGQSYLAPFWAFGYGQSRWGYITEDDVRRVADEYAKLGTPLDSIYLDIDYMQDFKDFTVNPERFSDLKKLAEGMKEQGIHLVPIIDAGVKIEDGYDVYEEGVANNYFCKNEKGKDFVGAVWPGKVHFPDFLQPEARSWFGEKYGELTKLGIDGFWNDMNEPAIFYSEESLSEAIDAVASLKGKNIGLSEYFSIMGTIQGLSSNHKDYDRFYHNVNGQMVRHSDIHNLFGMNMTRAANEALCKLEPEKRTLLFSRSSYIGAHRYGGIWQGDNLSWWSHILQGMQQLPALNMAGFMYIGSDTGGFGADTTEDLMLRWLQFALFTPLFRNHSALGTREQELYQFESFKAMTEMVKIRYALIPYLYSEYLKAVTNNDMMFKPLSFEFDDEESKSVEDQLLIGNELMIAPIYKQNASGRYVYLPEDMMLIRMRKYDDYETEQMTKGHHYIKVALDELVFFVRKDKAIPFAKPAKSTSELDLNSLGRLGYEGAKYEMYMDDGINPDVSATLKRVEI